MNNLKRDILLRRAKFAIDKRNQQYTVLLKLIHDNVNKVRKEGRNFLKPPPVMTGSEYAEKYMKLPETSFKKGSFVLSEAPQTKFWLDALWHEKVRIFVIMGSAQGGKTTVGVSAICQRVQYKPCYMMVMHPNEDNAKDFAKDIFESIIYQMKEVWKKFKKKTSKDESRVTKKSYEGGKINIGTALSKSFLRQKSAGFVWGDDIDGVKVEVSKRNKERKTQEEGDPVERLIARTKTFPDSVVYLTSTPTRKDASRIEYYYKLGNKCKMYVRCPECGYEFYFVPEGLNWEKDLDAFEKVLKHYPDTAYYKCPNSECGHHINEVERKKMLVEAMNNWKPEPGQELFEEISSCWFWDMNSKMTTMKDIAREIITAGDDEEKLETLYNNVFGLPYDKKHGESPDPLKLMERRYNFIDRSDMLMPNKVLMLTASVDLQQGDAKKGPRLEVKIMGFGLDWERFIIYVTEIPGSVSENDVWNELDKIWERKWRRKDGVEIPIAAIGIDTGWNKEAAYKYLRKKRWDKRFFGIKGRGTYGAELFSKKYTLVDKNRVRLIHIGHNTAMDDIYTSFKVDRPKDADGKYLEPLEDWAKKMEETPVQNYTHFCTAFCDAEYFEQLTCEEAVQKVIGALTVTVYEKPNNHARNEKSDLYKYCFALGKMKSPNFKILKEKYDEQNLKINKEKIEQLKLENKIEETKTIERPRRRTEPRRRG